MKKIIMFTTFFGRIPDYFDMFIQSIGYNKTIDFIIFTDTQIDDKLLSSNIKIIYISFEELVSVFQKVFPFKISCKTPYKITDYRPAFGEIFNQLIKGYDFWGYCDSDIIFGDIRKFITDEILENNDRIHDRGHYSIYKNCDKVNSMYKTNHKYACFHYKEVYKKNIICLYDEFGGFDKFQDSLGIKTYKKIHFADLDYYKFKFNLVRYPNSENQIFCWKNGRLFLLNMEDELINKKEIEYVHLQKRKMLYDPVFMNEMLENGFYIIPNKFIAMNKVNLNNVSIKELAGIEDESYKQQIDIIIKDKIKTKKDKFYKFLYAIKWKLCRYKKT